MKRLIRNSVRPLAWRLFRRVRRGPAAGLRFDATGFPIAYVMGTMEPAVQDAMRRLIEPGDVVYDIGANCGFFSMLAARLTGPGGQVYAFEPLPAHASAIRRNAGLNRFTCVTVREEAVGASSGTESLAVTHHPGGATLTSTGIVPPDVRDHIEVTMVAIDDLLEQGEIPPPHFIKLDVEGAERAALEGMSRTLRTAHPLLIYEVDDNDPEAFLRRRREIDALVASLGYAVEHLREAYAGTSWHVGHALARPLP